MVVAKQLPCLRAQKVRYYEDKYLRPIFEGQVDTLPLPPKLAINTGISATVKSSAVIKPRARTIRDDNDIPDEDFERQNGSQNALLEKIRIVKGSLSIDTQKEL